MQFTPDGYVEPLPPRPIGLVIGAVLVLGAVGIGVMGWWCPAIPLALVGILFGVNEGGKRRIRVTRPRLLMEDESRVRGLLIGPSRDRVEWAETQSVELLDDSIRVTSTSGRVVVLGKGGPKKELEKLFGRIEQVRNATD